MADAESSTHPQTLAPLMPRNNQGLPLSGHQLHPPRILHPSSSGRAIHQTEASATASVTTQVLLPTFVSAPVAHANASSVSHKPDAIQHYADLFQKERTRIKHKEAKAIDDEILALSEFSPGSLIAAAEARASSFARTPNQSHAFRPRQRFGRSGKDRARFPSAGSIRPVVMSQDPTHNLHGFGGELEDHEIQPVPSICVSGVAHDWKRGIASEIQPSNSPTVVSSSQSTPLINKAPPSSPVARQSGLSRTLPVPSLAVISTTSPPTSSPAATTQKPNTNISTTQHAGKGSALHECSGYPQQVEAVLSLDPYSSAIAQSSHSQRTSPASIVGSSPDVPSSLIARSPVQPLLPAAPPSTSVPSSFSAILHPPPANRPAARPSSNRQQGSSSMTQSVSIAVPVGRTSSDLRSRPKWMDDDETQEEKENAESEEWKKTHFSWEPCKNGNRSR